MNGIHPSEPTSLNFSCNHAKWIESSKHVADTWPTRVI